MAVQKYLYHFLTAIFLTMLLPLDFSVAIPVFEIVRNPF